ncbi:unnamed protein product [Brassica oleracea var. botrytis]
MGEAAVLRSCDVPWFEINWFSRLLVFHRSKRSSSNSNNLVVYRFFIHLFFRRCSAPPLLQTIMVL